MEHNGSNSDLVLQNNVPICPATRIKQNIKINQHL